MMLATSYSVFQHWRYAEHGHGYELHLRGTDPQPAHLDEWYVRPPATIVDAADNEKSAVWSLTGSIVEAHRDVIKTVAKI